MDDRPRPVVVLDMSQAKVLSAFDQEDRALPALLVEIPENSQPAAAGILSQSSRQISQVRRKYGPQVPLVGGLPPTGLQLEPFGETTFLEMISIYLSQATALKAAGCEVILIHSLPTLAEARAALLGARATGLPVWITVALHHSGEELSEGDSILPTFFSLQALGASGFGFSRPLSPGEMLPLFEEIAPYATIPLIALPDCLDEEREEVLTPADFGQLCRSSALLGVEIVGGGYGAGSAHILEARDVLNETLPQVEKVDLSDTIVLCNPDEVFYLDENLEFSEPIPCGVDMAEDFFQAEDSGCDVLCVEVDTLDDAYHLSLNSHLARLPIGLRSDSIEALDMALLLFNGRVLLDSRSQLEREELEELAARYGTLVL
ncbi:MAG TPA: homocysteine S-methyltransferase family protein [Firmicutes bacterium]|nr:homocysteine S-methyltransferase family protein [Bacillota bacterium]